MKTIPKEVYAIWVEDHDIPGGGYHTFHTTVRDAFDEDTSGEEKVIIQIFKWSHEEEVVQDLRRKKR